MPQRCPLGPGNSPLEWSETKQTELLSLFTRDSCASLTARRNLGFNVVYRETGWHGHWLASSCWGAKAWCSGRQFTRLGTASRTRWALLSSLGRLWTNPSPSPVAVWLLWSRHTERRCREWDQKARSWCCSPALQGRCSWTRAMDLWESVARAWWNPRVKALERLILSESLNSSRGRPIQLHFFERSWAIRFGGSFLCQTCLRSPYGSEARQFFRKAGKQFLMFSW